jgi:uncharacterized membrane protein
MANRKDRRNTSRTEGIERRLRARQEIAERRVEAVKARHGANRNAIERLAERLTRIAGSPLFLALHALWFAAWISINMGLLGIPAFDPYPFGLLTMIVSLEAIFLSIFVLTSQNREASIAELREEMTLEVDLRVEEEVTKTLHLVVGLYGRLGFSLAEDEELAEMLQPLDKARLEQELASQIGGADAARDSRRQE